MTITNPFIYLPQQPVYNPRVLQHFYTQNTQERVIHLGARLVNRYIGYYVIHQTKVPFLKPMKDVEWKPITTHLAQETQCILGAEQHNSMPLARFLFIPLIWAQIQYIQTLGNLLILHLIENSFLMLKVMVLRAKSRHGLKHILLSANKE